MNSRKQRQGLLPAAVRLLIVRLLLVAGLPLSHRIEILLHIAIQHQIGIAQRVVVDQVVQLAAVKPCLGKLVFHGDGVNCDHAAVRKSQLHANGVHIESV